jgi:hypothetical protein
MGRKISAMASLSGESVGEVATIGRFAKVPATPIVILAVEDKRNLQELEPSVYLRPGQVNLVGLFLHAPEKNYVLVWQNAEGLHPFAPIYHEYTHFALSRTGEWMPRWLSEGYAEY